MRKIGERLERYFQESKSHIEKIENARAVLSSVMPLTKQNITKLNEREQDKLEILLFRFAKLQDLLGVKIFRAILAYSGYDVDRPFLEIMSELEREGLLDIKRWIALRDTRNAIAHEYPGEEERIIEELNFIYEEVEYLMELSKRLQEYYREIASKRG